MALNLALYQTSPENLRLPVKNGILHYKTDNSVPYPDETVRDDATATRKNSNFLSPRILFLKSIKIKDYRCLVQDEVQRNRPGRSHDNSLDNYYGTIFSFFFSFFSFSFSFFFSFSAL